MPSGNLTDPKVRQAKPADKPYKLFDGGGLFLLVQPSGSKLWRLKYRFGGKEKLLAIGSYEKGVSLKKAREKREKAREQLVEGIDPSAARKEEKNAEREQAENTFRAFALNWAETYGARWTELHRDRVIASLEADTFSALGDLPIKDITPPLVLEVIRAVESRGALDVASRVLQRTSAVFRYAIQTGRATYNPAAGLPYFNPHSFRNTLVHIGQRVCKTPEQFKAWSQNLGHEKVLTTFLSYGEVACQRQGEIIRDLAAPQRAVPTDADEIAEAVFKKLRSSGVDV